ncbi:hypothetical protein [Burkholderia sp. Bp9142]|uniref:hypothetical protein n=1 Tax=Burkholderia sp. Bp9142 TaxID=2184573 RepID=UPI000F5A8480|nr:hypothetical protein [Burkholderia sp. Bp9142]RQR37859.1 hypothetical protein DIE22_10210 [Burkholderia sp. Bp9142]
MSALGDLRDAITGIVANWPIIRTFVNGGATETVETGSGTVPVIAKVVADAQTVFDQAKTDLIAQKDQEINQAADGVLQQSRSAADQASASAMTSSGNAAVAEQQAGIATQQAGIGAAANSIYATTAAGVAGVAAGRYFYVPATSAQGAYDVWLNSAGVAMFTGITLPNLAAVQANTRAIGDLQARGATLRYVPLSAGYDVVWGTCIDGAYRTWVDSVGMFHSTHTHDGLSSLPQALSNIRDLLGVAPKVLPLAPGQSCDYGWFVDGAYKVWVDSAGVFHSTHSHTEFAQFGQLRDIAPKVMPLAKNQDYSYGIVVDGAYRTWIDSVGTFHSTHTHPEIAPLQTAVAAIQEQLDSGAIGGNASGYLVEQVAKVNGGTTEQQIMLLDGQSQYRQLTLDGYNWRAPTVQRTSVVRAVTDYYFAGGNDAVSILPTGEIVPESGMVVHHAIFGQSLALGARGFVTFTWDPVNQVFTAATVFSSVPSPHGVYCLGFGDGTTGYARTGAVFNNFGVLQEAWSGVVGETVCSGFANTRNDKLYTKWGFRQRILMTSTGLGGTPYSGLKKGTAPYNSLISSVAGGKATANGKGWKYFVPTLYIVHGESESGNIADATYAGYLLEWISDFTTDIMPITGQRQPPVMILSQMNRQKASNEGVTLGQVLAHDNNANIILIGPKYQHLYYDDAHMLAEGYVKQGEYGERASRHWLARRKWSPLKPVSVVGAGNTITIQFNNTLASADTVPGPVGALAFDTTVVTNPGNYGFEYADGNGTTITNVALGVDGTSVVLTLSAAYVVGATLQYAMQSALNLNTMPTGQNTGSRGCLRDSDARDQSRFDGTNLFNWCVAFRKTLT